MKYELPNGHGLSTVTLTHLVFSDAGRPALSDAQHAALEAGIGREESLLVVSPTSTGKTQIALWAIAKSLESRSSTVYLVTHRALAQQKFDDFRSQILPTYLAGEAAGLVLATGDHVLDADGEVPKEPLRAPLLVATYEKYLGLLSAQGIPQDMTGTVVVCDEIQLLGDKHRGQSVELLLTLLKRAGWKQFVGLSAVLQPADASNLADWLGVKVVVEQTREKHLRYECWSNRGMAVCCSDKPERIDEGERLPAGADVRPISALLSLLREQVPPVPIIVFCMTKRQTYDMAEEFITAAGRSPRGQMSLAFDGLPETNANTMLSRMLVSRVASHNSDLTDEERRVVEQHLLDGKLDVVFATSTLAAGVNFPLGAAVFAAWHRWDFAARRGVPIEPGEFHNMAGRVGRMGFDHEQGRVIFFASNDAEYRNAREYLNLGNLPALEPRITPEHFEQLTLQLVASGLCSTNEGVEALVCSTFSGLRESDRNTQSFRTWPARLSAAVESLLAAGLLIRSGAGTLSATPVGKAVGLSGLQPATCTQLLAYFVSKVHSLTGCLPTPGAPGDFARLAFLLFSACFSTPEFRPRDGRRPSRLLPFPLQDGYLFDASGFAADLIDPVWQADIMPINAAKLSCDWIDGAEIRALESTLPQLSAGALRDLFRNLAWILQGVAAILTAAADKRVPAALRPKALKLEGVDLAALAKLPRVVRRLSFRVSEGLPDDTLWLTALNLPSGRFHLTRTEILSLRATGFTSPEKAMLGSPEADMARAAAFAKAQPSPQAKANWLRDSVREWKKQQRQRSAERHQRRASRCPQATLVQRYYAAKGTDFETAFEEALTFLKIPFQRLDDRTKTGAPDYLLSLLSSPPLIVELKSREGDKLVDYNKAVEVLAASEVHGHRDTFCVTLCHPGVDPSVPMTIAGCGRLCVVESNDLGEALLRVCDGSLTQEQLWQWLATPGQAQSSDLPFREYA